MSIAKELIERAIKTEGTTALDRILPMKTRHFKGNIVPPEGNIRFEGVFYSKGNAESFAKEVEEEFENITITTQQAWHVSVR